MKRFALVLLVACISQVANARLVLSVSLDELRDKADLVVIATPVKVKVIEEHNPIPNIRPGDIKSVVETTFKILTVLKGDTSHKEFILHHLSHDSYTRPQANGPTIVSFDPLQNRTYLLFLKRTPDGRYITAAGELDPHISIREIKEFYDAR